MPALLILDLLALLAVIWALIAVARSPAEKLTASRARITRPLAVAACLLAGGAIFNVIVYMGGPAAAGVASLGARTGLQARADEWLERNAAPPPQPDEVKKNMQVIENGLKFLRPYRKQLPPDVQLELADMDGLPTKITRILSSREEKDYAEAAAKVIDAVRSLSSRTTSPAPK